YLCVRSAKDKKTKRILTDDVGIEQPAEGETGVFRLAGEAEDAIDGDVRFDGDAEVHGSHTSSVRGLGDRFDAMHKDKVCEKADQKADKPRIVVQNAQR